MRATHVLVVAAIGLAGCPRSTTQPPDDSTAAPTTAATTTPDDGADAPPADPDCVSFVEPEVIAERYETGAKKLEDSRDGEHFRKAEFEEAMGALQFAAKNGHVAAQSLYGRTMFSVMFQGSAPEVDQRDDYVSALAFLRVAAKAGEEAAAGYLPGLTDDVPPTSEPPLESLPAPWVHAAYEMADAWIECHGLPKFTGKE